MTSATEKKRAQINNKFGIYLKAPNLIPLK